MARWTPDRIARLGFLAGCGFTVASIMSDGLVAARSKRAVRTDASRWHVPIGGDGGLPVALSRADQRRLDARCPGPWHHVGRARAHGASDRSA